MEIKSCFDAAVKYVGKMIYKKRKHVEMRKHDFRKFCISLDRQNVRTKFTKRRRLLCKNIGKSRFEKIS